MAAEEDGFSSLVFGCGSCTSALLCCGSGEDQLITKMSTVIEKMNTEIVSPMEVASSPSDDGVTPTPMVFFVDWDDTLLASSVVARLGSVKSRKEYSIEVQRELEVLERQVVRFLRELQKYGRVCIVTNAEYGWVELSAKRYMPAVLAYILKHNVSVISARTKYETRHPNNPPAWKLRVFKDEVRWSRRKYVTEECNVVSIGDSCSEREAAHSLRRIDPFLTVMTVKLAERPNVEILCVQLDALTASLRDICTRFQVADIDLPKRLCAMV